MVFWVGTFTAFKIDDVYSKVSEPIRQWGAGVGKGVAKLPLRMPFLPIPGGKAAPLSAIAGLPGMIEHGGQNVSEGKPFFQGMDKYFGGGGGSNAAQTQAMKKNIQTNNTVKTSISTNINAVNNDFNSSTSDVLYQKIKAGTAGGTAEFVKFDKQMKQLQSDIKTAGGGDDVSFEKLKEAGLAAGITIEDHMEELVNEWADKHG